MVLQPIPMDPTSDPQLQLARQSKCFLGPDRLLLITLLENTGREAKLQENDPRRERKF